MSKNTLKEPKKFKTRDLYEAAALLTSGEEIIDVEVENNICRFVFGNYDICHKKIISYTNNQLAVLAKDYTQAIKMLKGKIYGLIRDGDKR